MYSGKRYWIITIILLMVFSVSGCEKRNDLILNGIIESTTIDANSEVSGKVTEIKLDEGAKVKKGDIIASVDASMQELSIKQQEAVIRSKTAKLEELKEGSREQQIKQAEASAKAAKAKLEELKAGNRPEQIKQAEASVESSKANLESTKINYEYFLDKYNNVKELFDSDSASENDLDDVRIKMETAEKQYQAAEGQLKSAQAQLELLKNGPTSQSVKAAEANYEQANAQLELLKAGATDKSISAAQADLDQSQALLDQSKLTLSKYTIRAPIDGTYVARSVNVGDIVAPGTNIGSFSDLSDLWANVFIPRRYLNRISLGEGLNLKSSGQELKGKIIFISSEAEFTPKNVETSESKENMVFKVKVKLLDNKTDLKPGMLIDAYITGGGK
jgi:HlyD family secretion protein